MKATSHSSPSVVRTYSWRTALPYLGLGVLLLLYFHYLCSNRLIAQDEGFYVMAGKLVASGYAPYLDFFYPQMPLLPYLLGGWMAFTEASWSTARLLPALLNVVTGLVIYGHLERRLGAAIGTAGVILFVTSSLVISACGTTKTYAFSLPPLVAACVLLSGSERVGCRRAAGAGALLALAVNIRAPLAIALPAFLLSLCAPARREARCVGAFMAGFAFVCIPALVLSLMSYDAFWFNNLEYHLERAGTGDSAERASQTRGQVAERVFGLVPGSRLDLLPISILIYAALAVLAGCARLKRMPEVALTCGLLLVLGNFLPNPTYRQYFVTSDVLLSIGLLATAGRFLDRPKARTKILCALLAIGSMRLATAPAVLERYTDNGRRVIGISRSTVDNWRVPTVEKVGRRIDSLLSGGGPVMALWPGYLLSSGALPMPGLENHFAVRYVSKVHPSKDDIQKFRLISWREIIRSVRDRKPELIVFFLLDKPSFRSAVHESGYELVSRVENVSIYRRGRDESEAPEPRGESEGARESA